MNEMEKDEKLRDDFLRDLMRQSTLDSPSADFTDRVMSMIEVVPETAPAAKPFYLYLRMAIPYTILAAVLLFVILTSDFPFMQWMPGKDFFVKNFVPYFDTLIESLQPVFYSKFTSFGLMIGISAGMLALVDYIFKRRTAVKGHSAA